MKTSRSLLALAVLAAGGCGHPSQLGQQETMTVVRDHVARGEYRAALAALRASKQERPAQGNHRLARWKERDRVVYWMEEGTLQFLAADYRGALVAFHRALARTEELYTRSRLKSWKAVLTAGSQSDYAGTAHELLMLRVMSALCYLALGDQRGALVEANAFEELTRQLRKNHVSPRHIIAQDARYLEFSGLEPRAAREQARRLYDKNTSARPWFEPNPFGHWLAGLIREQARDLEGARRSLEQALQYYGTLQARYRVGPPLRLADDLRRVTVAAVGNAGPPRTGEVILVHFNGRGARLEERWISCRPPVAGAPAQETITYGEQVEVCAGTNDHFGESSFPVPRLVADAIKLSRLSLKAGGARARTRVAYPVAAVARQTHASRRQRLLWRSLVRARARRRSPSHEVGLWEADKRIWSTLPHQLEVARLELPAGKHWVEVVRPDGTQRSLGRVTVVPGQRVFLHHHSH